MPLQTTGSISVKNIWDEFLPHQVNIIPANGFGASTSTIQGLDRFKNFTRYNTHANGATTEFGFDEMYGTSIRTSSISVRKRTDTAVPGLSGDSVGYGFGIGSAQNFYLPENGNYYTEPNYGGPQRSQRIITNYTMTGLHAIEYSSFYRVTLSVTSNVNANYNSNAGFTTMELRSAGYTGNSFGGTGSNGAAALNRTDATYFSEVKYHGLSTPSSPMQWTWDSADKSTTSSEYGVFFRLYSAFSGSTKRAAVRFT
jgi:hypothetical protein